MNTIKNVLYTMPDIQQYIFTNKKTKKQVIDPLSCIIRLGILNYKPYGTKISISNNKIYFQTPSILQGPVRWQNGDTRLDLHNLLKTIQKAVCWYDLTNSETIYLFETSVKGLRKLSDCYNKDSNIISHTLNYYIQIIEEAIKKNKKNIINCDELKQDEINDESSEYSEDINKDDIKDIYYKPFSKLWNDKKINIIYKLFLELDNVNEEEQYSIINALECILEYKDTQISVIVTEFSTSL